MRTAALYCGLIVALAFGAPAVTFAHESTCKSPEGPSESMVAATQTLEENPRDLEARLRLADAQMGGNCFEDAVHTLEEGEAIHGRNAQLQSQLREARSMLREQSYFEGLNRAEDAAKLSHTLHRCNKLADIEACDQILARQPDNAQVLIAKGDALLQAKRAADAQAIYRRAYELTPTDTKLEQKIASAQTQRREFLDTCQSSTGQAALQACQWALLPGTDDEFAIRKRTGVLLQAANQSAAALDSYVAASLLKRGDRSVALAIVALSAGSGRNDALTLAARGSALLTLGRALEALTPLKQAVALSPDLPEAKAQLAQAERLAQVEARRKLLADAQPSVAATAQTTSARRYSNVAPNNRSN